MPAFPPIPSSIIFAIIKGIITSIKTSPIITMGDKTALMAYFFSKPLKSVFTSDIGINCKKYGEKNQ